MEKDKVKRTLTEVLSGLLLCVCGISCVHDKGVGQALEQACDNRGELELVLDHYKEEPPKIGCCQIFNC